MITRENEVAKKGEREIEGKRERERIYNLCKNLLTSTPVSKTLHMLNSHAYFWDMFTSQLLSQQCWLLLLSEPQHCLLTGLPPPPPPIPPTSTHTSLTVPINQHIHVHCIQSLPFYLLFTFPVLVKQVKLALLQIRLERRNTTLIVCTGLHSLQCMLQLQCACSCMCIDYMYTCSLYYVHVHAYVQHLYNKCHVYCMCCCVCNCFGFLEKKLLM